MIGLLRNLLSTEVYVSRVEKDRARLIYGITLSIMLFFGVFVVASSTDLVQIDQSSVTFTLAIVGMYVFGVLALVATRTGMRTLSAVSPLAMWYLSAMQIAIGDGFDIAVTGVVLAIFVLLSAFLLRERGLLVGLAGSLVAIGLGIYQRQFLPNDSTELVSEMILLFLSLLAMCAVLYFFLHSGRIEQEESIADEVAARLNLATLTTQLARRISSRTALDDLLTTAVTDIRSTYPDLYHVQIFLIDRRANEARLAASTGEVGQMLLKRQHSLPIGSISVIGQVTASGTPIVAHANAPDSLHRHNELLPDTAVEAAFPLRIGEEIIGALDLQSTNATVFDDQDDLLIFQSLADSIAVAIDNAQLVEQTEARLQENQRLLEQTRIAMREVERFNRELTERAWTSYLQFKGGELGVTVDFANNIVRQTAEATPTLETAIREGRVVQHGRDRGLVSVPVFVRGQVIGAMEFELDAALPPEDIALVQEVAERFGLALESARLYEESRRVAQRESLLNEISSRLQTTNTVDSLLAETARGLQSTLGANRVAIRLGAPPTVANGGGSR